MRAVYGINQSRAVEAANNYHYANRSGENIYRGVAVGFTDIHPFPVKESSISVPAAPSSTTPLNVEDLNVGAGSVLTELAPKGRNGLNDLVQEPLQPTQSHLLPNTVLSRQQQNDDEKRFALYKLESTSETNDLNLNNKRKLSNKPSSIYQLIDENQTHSENPYAINEHHHHQLHQHEQIYSSTYANNLNQPYIQQHEQQQQPQQLNKTAEYCWQHEENLAAGENQELVAAAAAAASRLDQSSVYSSSGSVEGSRYRASGGGQSAASDNYKHQASYHSSLWSNELITETSNPHCFVSADPYQRHHHNHNQTNSGSGPTSDDELKLSTESKQHQHSTGGQLAASSDNASNEYNQLRILEMRKEKSRDAARSRRSKENHEFYELAKLLPLPAAITSQLDFLDKASIIRLTISFLKLRQFSVNGYPPWAPDFTTLGSVNPYSSQSLTNYAEHHSGNSQDDSQSRPTSVGTAKQSSNIGTPNVSAASASHGYSGGVFESQPKSYEVATGRHMDLPSSIPPSSVAFPVIDPYQQPSNSLQERSLLMSEKNLAKSSSSLFDIHQGTHILQSLDGFAFAIGRDGRFLYISETVSMYLGLSQVEMTGSSVFDYAHQQDHEELAKQLGIPYTTSESNQDVIATINCESPPPMSVHSQYSAASQETCIDDHVNINSRRKRAKTQQASTSRGVYGRGGKRNGANKHTIKIDATSSETALNESSPLEEDSAQRGPINNGNSRIDNQGTEEDPLVRQFCIRMKSTLTKRGCQHFKSSGYRVVHVVAHLRSYQSNDHGHLMDPLDDVGGSTGSSLKQSGRRRSLKSSNKEISSKEASKGSTDNPISDKKPATKSKIIGMVAVAIALPPPSINELRLESGTFVLRLSLDLRVTHIEPKITELLHYPLELIAGKSLYSLIHPADVYQVQKCHKDLLKKGQMMSGYYRMLSRSGGYIWVQTCATLICNNTFNGQVPVIPNSPMPNSSSISLAHDDNQQHPHSHHIQKLNAGYMAPPSMAGSDIIPYGVGSTHSKIASPALSSQISSNYDNQDQDQCVIFVNYMITNIVNSDEILDTCQSSVPLCSFSGTTNNNNAIFNSPSSSCSSPCLRTLKADTSCGSYASPGTPNNSSANLLSPRPRVQTLDGKTRDARLANGRQRTGCGKIKSSYLSGVNSDENGHRQPVNNFNLSEDVKLISSKNHPEPVAPSTPNPSGAYGFYQGSRTGGSSALEKAQATETSWLAHHQPASLLGDASVAYGSAGNPTLNHYSTMDRSIYKAAFGLDVAGAASYGHQHQATAYPSGTSSYSTPSAVTNTWDTATAAAVAAVSNLTNHHHHHHNAANAYAQLENNHQASAHSFSHPATNHHTSASTYYNYYGYYGNEFI